MRSTLLPWFLLSCAACGDIDVRSVRTRDGMLAGEWTGSWQSLQGGGDGMLLLRIQDFGGEPVVGVQISHPCLPPADYEFRATASTFELLAAGEVVFGAVLGPERTLVGTYGCAVDTGAWDATWQRTLPDPVDLSGQWLGSVAVPDLPPRTLVLQLWQTVRSGALVIEGTLRLPEVMVQPLAIVGTVQFRDGAFDLVLVSAASAFPLVHLAALGDTPTRRITGGQLQAAIDPSLPLVQATWEAQWQQR
ncbi:MAG: hypothetical protein KF830_08100 [Planctomycetes bacterium]|nr:hypothetical protein [Planctomycetota bacterium]